MGAGARSRCRPAVVAPGTSFRQHWKLLGHVLEITYEVLDYDPDRAFAYQGIAGPVGCFVRSSFAPILTGTHVTWRAELDLLAAFQRQTPLALRVARRLLQPTC